MYGMYYYVRTWYELFYTNVCDITLYICTYVVCTYIYIYCMSFDVWILTTFHGLGYFKIFYHIRSFKTHTKILYTYLYICVCYLPVHMFMYGMYQQVRTWYELFYTNVCNVTLYICTYVIFPDMYVCCMSFDVWILTTFHVLVYYNIFYHNKSFKTHTRTPSKC